MDLQLLLGRIYSELTAKICRIVGHPFGLHSSVRTCIEGGLRKVRWGLCASTNLIALWHPTTLRNTSSYSGPNKLLLQSALWTPPRWTPQIYSALAGARRCQSCGPQRGLPQLQRIHLSSSSRDRFLVQEMGFKGSTEMASALCVILPRF